MLLSLHYVMKIFQSSRTILDQSTNSISFGSVSQLVGVSRMTEKLTEVRVLLVFHMLTSIFLVNLQQNLYDMCVHA